MNRIYSRYVRWMALWLASLGLGLGTTNVAVDPFNRNRWFAHWSLPKDEISYPLNRPLFELHRFDAFRRERDGLPHWVIIGDSRSNQLDEQVLNAGGWARWFNFSYGGATFGDALLLAEHAMGSPDLEGLVFSLSFLRFDNASQDQQVRRALAEHGAPLHYFSALTTRASAENILSALTGWRLSQTKPRMSEEQFWHYVLARQREDLKRWSWPDGQLATLLSLREAAQQRGVRFLLMVPPDSPDVHQLINEVRRAEVDAFNHVIAQFECLDFRAGFGAGLRNTDYRDPLHLNVAAAQAFSQAFAAVVAPPPQKLAGGPAASVTTVID